MLVPLVAIFLVYFYINYIKFHPRKPEPSPLTVGAKRTPQQKYDRLMDEIENEPWIVWREHLLIPTITQAYPGLFYVVWITAYPVAFVSIQELFRTIFIYDAGGDEEMRLPKNFYDMFDAGDWYRTDAPPYEGDVLHVNMSVTAMLDEIDDFRHENWLRALGLLFKRFNIVIDQTIIIK
jgi:hypothetical protein